MKKILLLFCALVAFNYATAQTLSPEVITTSGTSMSNGTTTLDWTLGEPATATLDNSTNLLSQGFHQPSIVVTTIADAATLNDVKVFPNPTIDVVQIQFTSTQKNTLVEVYSVDGKLLEKHLVNSQALEINMSTYPAGTYLLKINKSETHKLLKSH
jgi:hypothetical protein